MGRRRLREVRLQPAEESCAATRCTRSGADRRRRLDGGDQAAEAVERAEQILWNAGSVSGDDVATRDGAGLDQTTDVETSSKPTRERRRGRPHAFLGDENPSSVSDCVDMNTP
jgi:hypothetical protein